MDLIRYLVRRYSPLLNEPFDPKRGGTRMNKDQIGRQGERIAARYLFAHGAKVLYRNYRAPGGGEIDLVLRHGEMLAFAEVKTRTSADFGRPALAVDFEKQVLISRGVNHWLRLLHHPQVPWRCDIVEVELRPAEPPKVTWLQGAFEITDIKKRRPRKWTRTA